MFNRFLETVENARDKLGQSMTSARSRLQRSLSPIQATNGHSMIERPFE